MRLSQLLLRYQRNLFILVDGFVYFFWAAPLFLKIILNVVMIFTFPTPQDLFMSYQDYLDWWEESFS